MTDRLDKAQQALDDARQLSLTVDDRTGLVLMREAEQFSRLVHIAEAQAAIATAETLQRIAGILEHNLGVKR